MAIHKQITIAIGQRAIPVARLQSEFIRGKELNSFEYLDSWISNGFPLSPGLPLAAGRVHSAAPPTNPKAGMPGALSDAGPDGWGRTLIRKRTNPRLEIDYLLAVDDQTRPGALRLLDGHGRPLAQSRNPIPSLHSLNRLQALCDRIDRDPHSDAAREIARELRGTGDSLGGARPKAVVIDAQGVQHLAKFTVRRDERPIARLEVATLKLANAVGINACSAALANPKSQLPTALIKRFDRTANGGRVPYISAQTLLDAKGGPGDAHYYSEMVEALRAFENGGHSGADASELHRRILFMILISSTDDHLRNHGFLRGADGWRLCPAFDINPQPDRHPMLKTGISPELGFEPSVDAWMEAAPLFFRSRDDCRKEASDMAAGMAARWPALMRQHGLSGSGRKQWHRAVNPAQTQKAMSLTQIAIPVSKKRGQDHDADLAR